MSNVARGDAQTYRLFTQSRIYDPVEPGGMPRPAA
jgi:hypothetical protein